MTENNAGNQIDLAAIVWREKNPSLQEKDMHLLSQLPYSLPERYIELLKISNGGYLVDDIFKFYNKYFKRDNSNCTGQFIGLLEVGEGYNSIIYCNREDDLPEFFPQGLLIFTDPGGGGYVCFDYRNDPKSNNPPVVFWSSGADEGEDIFFLAKDFDAFLYMLYADED